MIDALNALASEHPREGFWIYRKRLRIAGRPSNHKRLYRVYVALKLNLPRRGKKRLPPRVRLALEAAPRPDAVWSVDFMGDALYYGRKFRLFNVVDDFAREGLAIVFDTSINAERVIRVLDNIAAWRGYPDAIRCDNGPEFLSQRFIAWCAEHGIDIRYSRPGKPNCGD